MQFSCGILFAIATTVPALYIMQKYLYRKLWGHRKIRPSLFKVIITHALATSLHHADTAFTTHSFLISICLHDCSFLIIKCSTHSCMVLIIKQQSHERKEIGNKAKILFTIPLYKFIVNIDRRNPFYEVQTWEHDRWSIHISSNAKGHHNATRQKPSTTSHKEAKRRTCWKSWHQDTKA